MGFDVRGSANISGDMSVASHTPKPACPCCGSSRYHQTKEFDAKGVVIHTYSSCLECRDKFCLKCKNGD